MFVHGMTTLINDELEIFSQWLCVNKLKHNVHRTKCVFLSSRPKAGYY